MHQMNEHDVEQERLRIAEDVRAACLAAALDAYEQASMRGLCHEGAWECAIGAIRSLKLQEVVSARKFGAPTTARENRE
jgi:hypothetical protein